MTAIRLLRGRNETPFLVVDERVYEDTDKDGHITSCERAESNEALRVARILEQTHDLAFSVGAVVDGEWQLAGTLTDTEVRDLDKDGVRVCRTALERHLDFFDGETRDGIITLRENWNGWRRLGYGWLRSLIGTLGSAMVFGRMLSGFSIDIAAIGKKRKRARSGLYADDGNVDPWMLAECLDEFDRETYELYGAADRERLIPQQRAFEIVTTVAAARGRDIGSVSARQFTSLFRLCTRLNHGQKAITANQFTWLFDGSLLYRAASLPGTNGRTRSGRAPSRVPVLAVLFTIALAVACAPRPGDAFSWIRWLQAAVPLLAALVLAKSIPERTGVERAVIISVGILVAATIIGGLTLQERLPVWAVIALAAIIAIVQQRKPLVQYLAFCRYPLLLAITTIALPFIAAGPAHTLFKSMLALRLWSIAFVVLLTVLAASVFVNTASLIAHQASRRFTSTTEWSAPGEWIDRSSAWLIAAIAAPTSIALVLYAEARTWVAVLGVIAGAVAALSIKVALKAAGSTDIVKRRSEKIRRSVGRRLEPIDNLRGGYVGDDGTLIEGHTQSAAFLTVTLAMYVAGYLLLMPGSFLKPPAIAYVIFILIVLGWTLPAVSFFTDKFRVSTILALVAVPVLLYFINDIDHYFDVDVRRTQSANGDANDVGAAFKARLERWTQQYPGEQPVMVAIAAGGGGGSSAYWTTRVLAGLQGDNGQRFTDAIDVVSAVSGGSVGSLYFLDAVDERDRRAGSPVACDRAVVTARASTLEPIAWGLAYPDLWRFFGIRPFSAYHDRGWAFEQALDRQLCHPGTHLSDWRADMVSGRRPAVLFNATATETGARIVLSPLHFADPQAKTIEGVYGADADLRAVTAARLSATFPWVTPLARARHGSTPDQRAHLADGGYYDNAGIVTAIQWARVVSEQARVAGVRKMLVVTLGLDEQTPPVPNRAGWTLDTIGPIVTMLNVRGASQQARNKIDLALWSQVLQATLDVEVKVVDFPLNTATSVSWRLSDADVQEIETYWNSDHHVQWARKEVARFMTTPASTQ